MLNIVLFEPEIPPNTGNIIRLCANTGCTLHLIKPMGFDFDDKRLRRAGLDYHEWANTQIHDNYSCFLTHMSQVETRILAITSKGDTPYHQFKFQENDTLLLGPETRGLPDTLLHGSTTHQRLRIPMQVESRSLNLSNATAIVCYEALRQFNFSSLEL
jgi:tRNA (cytidine/uridine-2'-O-)-methyltransferase